MFQSIPTHGFQRPQEDSHVFQLFKEFPSSEFQRFDDLQWLSSLNHVEPASSSSRHGRKLVPGNLIPPEPSSQSMAPHQATRPHENLICSGSEKQLVSEPEQVDNLSWLFTTEHDDQSDPSPPEPLFLPQAQYLLKPYLAIQKHAHSSKDYAQHGDHSQIQSHPPFDNHKHSQGKCRNIENLVDL